MIVYFMGMWLGDKRGGDELTPIQAQRQLMALEGVLEEPCPIDEISPDVFAELERHGLVECCNGTVKPTAAVIYYAQLIEVA